MKSSRSAAQSSVQREEDCGVWLDTVKLKGKVQKKRSGRPISKLLNPFTDGAGYNVAVALNFTQTKMEMPKTKQSSISNFFTCQRRVLNKMSTSGGQNEGEQETCSSTTATTSGDFKSDFNNEPQWSDVDYNQVINTQQPEPPATMWRKTEDEACNRSSLPNTHSDYKEEASLNQFMNKSDLTSNTCDIRQENSECPLHCNHESCFPTQNGSNAFGGLFNAEGRTSTQNCFNGLSLQNDEENTTPKNMPMSESHVQTARQILQKRISREACTQDQDEGFKSSMKWTKPKNLPIKSKKSQFGDSDDESLSMLFTQDSQGFRVMAHRGLQTRSPLKDQSNINVPVPSAVKSLEDEDEMLFTQDSQGNMVIKH
ncbi:uncharacterized protein [Eucyclogobius newberryi]|uniref:uncharacterized protein n=1 Tax=Eucyclogobius newberryi TaxID=166745 RepID=UPI003B5B31FC